MPVVEKGSIFKTGPYGEWGAPTIGLRHVLSWPKLELGPKLHDPRNFGSFGKRGHTDKIHVL